MKYTIETAREKDRKSEIAYTRKLFRIPQNEKGEEQMYFLGNSLGLQPKSTRDFIEKELDKWHQFGVEAHFKSDSPWLDYNEELSHLATNIVGAKPTEIVTMNSLTVNVHLLLATFYKPTGNKTKILVEDQLFPSDSYALQSQMKLRNLLPESELIRIHPRDGEKLLRHEDILTVIQENKDELALIWLGGVNYLTGQLFDFEEISKLANKLEVLIGIDLAHGAGNVKLKLHEWGIDFAAWCTYKYLNSGPGGIGQAFIHEKHQNKYPAITGWWGNKRETQFLMRDVFEPEDGASAYQISTSPILLMACLKSSLDLINQVGFDKVVTKNQELSSFLYDLMVDLKTTFHNKTDIEIITPAIKYQRGAQLSIVFDDHARDIFKELSKQGIFVDWREPNVIRLAPTALYNTYEEIFRFYQILGKTISEKI